ncbi:MAG: class B sortase [Bacillus sp. (in: Bacteria)]|nr:class B sortase [Bacillus sp. (in: firmicutes)]MCM1426016.1 class B sortase [Eubacterium sp.]
MNKVMVGDKKKRIFSILLMAVSISGMITGCGNKTQEAAEKQEIAGIATESAEDAQIDFAALQEENPDIFAWIYIPDTQIDYPVLQSGEADDFYESHNAYGQADTAGAVYIELANLTSMCDFNTVFHGKTQPDGNGLFSDLYRFADPDFFDKHEKIYLYLDGNVLTYEVFAAYERENTSLIRSYDFTYIAGCQQFLDDLYGLREMNKNLREGWEDLTPYHFLLTLTTQKDEDAEKQYVVVAALIEDAAGTIDRVVIE